MYMRLFALFIVRYFGGQVVAQVPHVTDLVLHHWRGERENEDGREGITLFHLHSKLPSHTANHSHTQS